MVTLQTIADDPEYESKPNARYIANRDIRPNERSNQDDDSKTPRRQAADACQRPHASNAKKHHTKISDEKARHDSVHEGT